MSQIVSLIVLIFIVAALLFFLILSFVRAARYSRYPIHSRLELYPVPKEGRERAEYGGSYLEETGWWKKPRVIDKGNETKDILLEMVFIRKLFQHQRSLWWASYVFHLGIYVMAGWTVLLLLAALLPVTPLVVFTIVVGGVGFVLATLGSLLLLIRRLTDSTLRAYTTPQEFFNLLLILVVLITGIMSWSAVSPIEVVASLFSPLSSVALSPLIITHIILLGLMFIYIPVSKMSHYVGKFFAFHKVLWDNDPNFQGNDVDERLRQASSRTPQQCWSAPHINPNDEVGQ